MTVPVLVQRIVDAYRRGPRAAAWEQILVEWPLDLLAFRQHTGALFWSGDKQYQAEVTAGVATYWGPKTPGHGHFLSVRRR